MEFRNKVATVVRHTNAAMILKASNNMRFEYNLVNSVHFQCENTSYSPNECISWCLAFSFDYCGFRSVVSSINLFTSKNIFSFFPQNPQIRLHFRCFHTKNYQKNSKKNLKNQKHFQNEFKLKFIHSFWKKFKISTTQ